MVYTVQSMTAFHTLRRSRSNQDLKVVQRSEQRSAFQYVCLASLGEFYIINENVKSTSIIY